MRSAITVGIVLLVMAVPTPAEPVGTVKEVRYVAAGLHVNCGNDAGHIQTPVVERPEIHRNCAGFWHDGAAQTVHIDIDDFSGGEIGAGLVMYDYHQPGGPMLSTGVCGSGSFDIPAGIDHISVVFNGSYYSYLYCGHDNEPTTGTVTLTY